MPVKKCNKIRCFVCYSLKSIIQRIVRVLSLRSSVIHGFVTEPWYSHHVRVFMWARGFECARVARSLVCIHCFVWSVVFGFRHSCLEFRFVSGFGHSRSIFCHCVSAQSRVRSLSSTCVLLCCTQFVFLSAACIYVISCAVWHAACIFIGCVLSCCLVWTRGLWVFSLAACSCPVLYMAGDLFAGHVLVFCFVWARGFCPSFLCAMCSHVILSWPHPSCYLFID